MARFVSSELPDDLYRRLAGEELEKHAGKVILVLTVDAEGWPHPALLSYLEVVARDRRSIRFATYAESGTSRNLRRNGILTLAVVDARVAYYVKGKVRELAPRLTSLPHSSKMELRVEQVLSDEADPAVEGGGYLSSGMTYASPDPAGDLRRAREVLRELLE
jgi:hypothetical protein